MSTPLNAVDPGHALDREPEDCLACRHSQRYPKNEHALGCIHPRVAVKSFMGHAIATLASVVHGSECKGDWKEARDGA